MDELFPGQPGDAAGLQSIRPLFVLAAVGVLFCFVIAALAKRKGYSFFCWFLTGFAVLPSVVVLAILPKARGAGLPVDDALRNRRRGNRAGAVLSAAVVGLLVYRWADGVEVGLVAAFASFGLLWLLFGSAGGLRPFEAVQEIGCRCAACGTSFAAPWFRRGENVNCPTCKGFVSVPREVARLG